ncbi:hypothetical protein L873DRAFT_652677 [Choiromyces venosus 120613-1]|uniref:Uncharacterized protein n=1 Tax=Choiromyces venosus 120613-1 TaxID=1336337 RepID=A0A3N4IUI7_9PEZI|nr:hypothetical protein L873DRAFT_652677 [Choiromyces venosus 120613-1]
MSESTNYLFAASFSTLERPTSKLLSHRFTSSIIPAGQMLSPYELTGEYEAVDFYSNKPLNLEKPKPQGGLATIKNVWTTMSFKGAVKQSGSHIKPSKAHRKYLNSLPKPEKSKYEIIRYELKPKLNFVLEPRLWYPVEHAWQIYNYDRTYLSSPQIERLEQLQRERDYALGMMRDGHRSYWSMVRDAEIGMFGESPDFGTRPKEGRFTPRLGRGRAELKSYRVERGKSARLLAADGFKRRVVVSIWDNDTRVDGAPPAENNTLAIPHIYGQVLDGNNYRGNRDPRCAVEPASAPFYNNKTQIHPQTHVEDLKGNHYPGCSRIRHSNQRSADRIPPQDQSEKEGQYGLWLC